MSMRISQYLKRCETAAILPSERTTPLVMAALGLEDTGSAWSDYLARLDNDRPEDGESRLFSFVAAKLGRSGEQVPKRQWLSAAQRRATVSNMRKAHIASTIVQLLDDAGIDVAFSKGWALNARLYRQWNLRFCGDLDIHIPLHSAKTFWRLAVHEGWTPRPQAGWTAQRLAQPPQEAALRALGSSTFNAPVGQEIDVHGVPRREFAWCDEAIDHFFASTRRINWNGTAWPVPSDDWLLVEALTHGIAANRVSPIRWIVDAHGLLNVPDAAVDWATIVNLSRLGKATLPLHIGLDLLARLDAPIDGAALQDMAENKVGLPERMYFKRLLDRDRPESAVAMREATHYLLRGPAVPLHRLFTLPTMLRRDFYGYASWFELLRKAWT